MLATLAEGARPREGDVAVMAELPYAWLGDVQAFLDTPEDEILRKLTSFAKETGAPQVLAWDRTLRTLRDELGACLPDAARFALVLEFEVPRSGGQIGRASCRERE